MEGEEKRLPDTQARQAVSAELVPHAEAASRAMVQMKLAVGSTDDPAEHEADAVADLVVGRIRRGAIERDGPAGEDIRRSPAERIRRRAGGGDAGGAVDRDTEQRIQSRRGSGDPLPDDVASDMSAGFGTDLSHVRLHTGPEAAELNNRLQAKAFTVGSDVFLRDPTDLRAGAGQELLAHELTHVVQQTSSPDVARRYVEALSVHEIELWELNPAGDGMMKAYEGSGKEKSRITRPAGKVDLVAGPLQFDDHEYYLLPSTKYYVRDDNVQIGVLDEKEESSTALADEDLAGAIDVGAKFTDDMGDAISVAGGSPSDEMGYAAGSFNILGGFSLWASAVESWKKGKAVDKGLAGLEAVEGAAKVGSGIAGIADTAGAGGKETELKDWTNGDEMSQAGVASKALAAVGDAASGIQASVKAVRKLADLIENWSKKSVSERAKEGVGVIQGALTTAQASVKSARTFLGMWGNAGPLASVVPGLGVAIAACELVVRFVSLATAIFQQGVMRARKQELKKDLGGKVGESFKASAEKRIAELQVKGDLNEAEGEELGKLQEYLMAKGIQYINKKRQNRALFKTGVALTDMAGDIATLGVATAPVGAAFKGAAVAADTSASLFRRVKQWGRNKAAERKDAGKSAGLFGMFDASKSSDNKFKMYNAYVDKLYDMVLKTNEMPETSLEERKVKVTAVDNVYNFVRGMGMSKAEVDSLCQTPTEMREKLIKKLKERD